MHRLALLVPTTLRTSRGFSTPAAAILLLLLLLAAPFVALAQTLEPIGASPLDARLHAFLYRVDEARQAGESPATLQASLADLYPGIAVSADGSGLTVDCLIQLEPGDHATTLERLMQLGIVTRTEAGAFVTASIPLAALEALDALPGLQRVELARRLTPSLDASRLSTHADQVWGAAAPPYPSTGLTGRGTVVGIVDTGIDLTHGDFKNADGTTRIGFLWDQTATGTPPSPYSYGVEWTAAAIDAGLATENDTNGHGTHVAGVAVGNGSATGGTLAPYTYTGVAPEAGIVFVKTTFMTTSVIDACRYIFSRAAGRPCVINLSLGTSGGPHDTTDPFNQALDALTGPGKLIVAAAGNAAGGFIHGHLLVPPSGPDSVVATFTIPTYTPQAGTGNDYLAIDGWYGRNDNISFLLQSPAGRRTPFVPAGNQLQTCLPAGGGDGHVIIENSIGSPSVDREMYLEVNDGTQLSTNCQAPRAGTWRIVARRTGAIQSGAVDFWIFASQFGNGSTHPSFVLGRDESMLIESPASAANVVAVGATITKVQWLAVAGNIGYTTVSAADIGKIAPFSSLGPLRDLTIQPDIVAPGMGIASARSHAAFGNIQLDLRDGQHTINQGTSQAAPHIAGAIALIQQKLGPRTPAQILTDLRALAAEDAITGPTPNNTYGNGRIDLAPLLNPVVVPVVLTDLAAAATAEGGVRLSWAVTADEPLVGFHVYRADAADAPYARLTAAPLAPRPELDYTDIGVMAGHDYWYRVEAVRRSGPMQSFGPLEVRAGAPRLELAQNGPNPLTATTTIRYALPAAGPIELRVFDLKGALVRTLVHGPAPVGAGRVEWDARDGAGRPVPAGVYFYQLTTPFGGATRKMLVRR